MTTSADRTRVAPLLLSTLATLFFLESLRGFFSAIYFFNLTSLGINATVLYALLLLAPLIYWWRWQPAHAPALLLSAIVVLAGARVAMTLAWSTPRQLPWAGLTAAAFLVFFPAALRVTGPRGKDALAMGLALGWALDASIVVLGRSVDTLALPAAWPAVAFLAVGLIALASISVAAPPRHEQREPAMTPRRTRAAALGIGAWVFLEHAILAPHVLSRWNGIGLGGATAVTLAGVLLASALAIRATKVPPSILLALNGLALVAFVDDGFVHSRFLPYLMLAAQAALVLDIVILVRAAAARPFPQVGRAFVVTSTAILALHFAFAFSFTFAFIPLKFLWQHAERVLPLLAMTLVLVGVLAHRAQPWTRPTLVARMPRATLIVLLLIPATLGAWGVNHESTPLPDGAADNIVIATYNVHQGFNAHGAVDGTIYETVLRELNADIIVLQESDTTRFTSANLDIVHLLATRIGYHAYGGPATNEQSVGIALLSRYPIHDAHAVKLPTTTDNRYVFEARLDIHGRNVWIYGTHLGLELPDREWQTDTILTLATKTPRILIGDFNSCPNSPCPDFDGAPDTIYQKLTVNHTDAWVAAGHDPTDPAGWTYPTQPAPIERIDHIYVDQALIVTRANVQTSEAIRNASDHLPLVATLRFAAQ